MSDEDETDDDFDFEDAEDEEGGDEDDDDDYSGGIEFDDDDDDDDEDDEYDYGDNEGGGKGPLIALIAVAAVVVAGLGGLGGWLALSFDQDAYDEAHRSPEVITELVLKAKSSAKKRTPAKASKSKQAAKPPAKAAPTATDKPVAAAKSARDSKKEALAKITAGAGTASKSEGGEDADKVVLAAIDPELIDETVTGKLPKIAPDGRMPWQVYARPFTAPDKKTARIAIVIAGLGLSKASTQSAIQRLPGAVTLAFAPYARGLEDWIAQARAAGHEVVLELPMEPADYPDSDPGPHTLLTKLDDQGNLERLNWLLGRFSGYVGVTNFMGAKFTASEEHMTPILTALKDRGLLYLDARANRKSVAAKVAKSLDMPRAANNRFIDSEASRVSIDARLYELERIAKSVGVSIGIGFSYPVTMERLTAWLATFKEKGLVLAPLSALANAQPIK